MEMKLLIGSAVLVIEKNSKGSLEGFIAVYFLVIYSFHLLVNYY